MGIKHGQALAALSGALLLGGCASVEVGQYAAAQPALELPRYFNGTVDGWGMYQSRSGEVVKRFHVVIDARWTRQDGREVGTLDERFSWSDGTSSRRVWTVTRHGDRQFSGRAADVVGEARGEAAGNALRWRYVLALPAGGRVWNVDVDDWMYLMDEQVMLNRSAVSKFGIHVGDITLSFRKRQGPP
jgi:hypothetical protein